MSDLSCNFQTLSDFQTLSGLRALVGRRIANLGPRADEIPEGWHVLTSGQVRLGDKFWTYARRRFLPVRDSITFRGSFVDGGRKSKGLMTVIIRKD